MYKSNSKREPCIKWTEAPPGKGIKPGYVTRLFRGVLRGCLIKVSSRQMRGASLEGYQTCLPHYRWDPCVHRVYLYTNIVCITLLLPLLLPLPQSDEGTDTTDTIVTDCAAGEYVEKRCVTQHHIIPFLHPFYTVIAVHTPMYTRYTIHTPLNTSKHL